ncbi:hypothetical protein C6501_19375 [Candidatus Poribacteria bacterium]|nr:MAG: hypothetical protein C6501_19375 [Candidatus Poribacteria bacterium]
MKLQEFIFDETFKWVKESNFITKKYNDELYIQLHDLAQYFGGATKTSFENKLKNVPGYGDPEQNLICIKYLPYFLAQYTPRDVSVRDKIHATLKRIGFMIPTLPVPKLYFIKFCDKDNGEMLCKIGWTSTSIQTRLNSSRQQVGKLANGEYELITYIETLDAGNLEEEIREDFGKDRVDKFDPMSTVGKGEIYKLTLELHERINILKDRYS